jgi:hypothetical protein
VELQAFDFGAVRKVNEDLIQGMVNLVYHGGQSSRVDPVSLLIGIGFDKEKLKHIAPQCGEIVRLFSEPFSEPFRYEFKTWNLFKRMKMILAEDHWWFRSAGSTDFLLIMKSFQGLMSILNTLDVGVNFLDPMKKVAAKNWQLAEDSIIEKSSLQMPMLDSLAKRLYVKVIENGVEKVSLSLAITCIYDLESLLEPEVLQKIESDNINVGELVANFLKQGAMPGTIFEARYDGKDLKVWAE